jgi:hypothetical protein
MSMAPWTYEVRAGGEDSVGLEDYVVEDGSGEPVGKVIAVLERRDELYVAVERGTRVLGGDLRAVPWEDVERVDHNRLVVRLRIAGEAIEEALALDPTKEVEGASAEAHRVTELPRALRRPSAVDTAGPVDRARPYVLVFGSFALSLLAFLVLVVAALAVDFTWHFALFAIPVLLLLVSGVAGYRLFRRPYGGRP